MIDVEQVQKELDEADFNFEEESCEIDPDPSFELESLEGRFR